MSNTDQTDDFLESLPEVGINDTIQFACHPGVKCFNACCGDLNLVLTPYDVLRLRRAMNMSSQDFIQKYADVMVAPDTGFPALRLRMLEGVGKPCPFVRESGCAVYSNRPGACRTYPIGRAMRFDENQNIVEQFFLVQESHCVGFREEQTQTLSEWLTDQGLEEYNDRNDKYALLLGRQKKVGQPIDNRKATMALMALYQLDNFQRFVKDMQVFARLDVDEERQKAILEDEEAALLFAQDWLELVILGDCERLSRK